MSNTFPLPIPPTPPSPHADTTITGQLMLPIERIKLYSDHQWEEFVLEWAHGLKTNYARVERRGSAGDMGLDVVAYPDATNVQVWDNYQCKHYAHPLRPSEIWIELGKIIYYTYQGEFSYPRKYCFIAPQGAGTTLSKLLKSGDRLREQLIENWDQHCRKNITSTQDVKLDTALMKYINSLDFSIFDHIPPLRLIDEHRATPYHIVRFGGGLPLRPDVPPPPDEPSQAEVAYLRKLFDAYTDHLKRTIQDSGDINNDRELKEHYVDTRVEFYSAEALRNFSRDTLPEGLYEQLQNEVYDGVRDVMRGEYDDGYRRLLAVVIAAKNLPLTAHALVPRLYTRDKGGICHQLANERENVKWVK